MTGNSRDRRKFAAVLCACAAVILFASSCGQVTPADTRVVDESTIREMDVKWSKAATAKDLEGTVSYYGDDASLLPPNTTIQIGKTAVHAAWAGLLGSVDSIAWQPNKIEVSKSSDMAYVIGVYQLASKDPQGKPVLDHGKYVEVWKKQGDGNWKVVADIFNTDLLPETPAPAAKAKSK
jgi:ketosteroid isomerase-like protein